MPSSQPPLKPARCPYCSKEFEYASVSAHKSFPFCSSRCRDIDLGKWFMGLYAVPGPEGLGLGEDGEELAPDRDATA
jgi:endogenous inhibitor of DNA gyrase (YacG/DUF329 family)